MPRGPLTAYRALKGEASIECQRLGGYEPSLVRAGRVRSLCQGAALFYLWLDLSVKDVLEL
jgi:hypothetical protein